jgi:hypothetical protein
VSPRLRSSRNSGTSTVVAEKIPVDNSRAIDEIFDLMDLEFSSLDPGNSMKSVNSRITLLYQRTERGDDVAFIWLAGI